MFVYPGNERLCIADGVPISVNPGLSSVPGTGLVPPYLHSENICCCML